MSHCKPAIILAGVVAGALSLRGSDTLAEHIRTERMAAWHKTVVATDEVVPNSSVFTYLIQQFTYTENNLLAKIQPEVQAGDTGGRAASGTSGTKTGGEAKAEGLRVEDTPGGVVATFKQAGVRVRTEITPLFVGRKAEEVEGAATYVIVTEPPTPVTLRISSGKSLPGNAGLRASEVTAVQGEVTIKDGRAQFRSGMEQIPVCIAGSGAIAADGEKNLSVKFENGRGHLIIAFARKAERAAELAGLDTEEERKKVGEYYEQLWAANHIETPEPVLDDAFKHALRTLEYTWIEPYGWLECIHHWYSLWHMQMTAGAEWVGQTDRSRSCTMTHADMLTAENAVPQFSPNGLVHRDFGGSNQFWAWQARHYWQFTGDEDFARKTASKLDKVIDQTFREYDKDNNLLLAWGLQIGNQEDYVATPYDGTTPSIEGINMMLTRAELARASGDATTAELFESRAARMRSLLRERLWMPDLGRLAFFVDPQGHRRLDGQYHTLAYPVIWGLTDALDSYTTLRQMNERLTGKEGEVYCSNNFPNHVGGTWGMQAGAAQQPWAAWALSAAGQFERAYLPLKSAARWAMDANHRGAWPEIAQEATPAYFSPPAGLYVAATVEALFGLKVDVPAGVLTVSPSFPSAWPGAKLKLADYSAEFTRATNRIEYRVESKRPLKRHLRWHLPPAQVRRVLVNGREVPFTIEPAINAVLLCVDTVDSTATSFVIEYEPVEYRVNAPGSVAEGDPIDVELVGARIERLDDRCGVLSQVRPSSPSRMVATLRRGLLDPYLPYGRLGQLTFSRRTFFLQCVAQGDVRFWAPVDLLILPRFEVNPRLQAGFAATATAPASERKEAVLADAADRSLSVNLHIHNNTFSPLKGQARLSVGRGDFPFDIDIAARKEITQVVRIPAEHAALLSVGDNDAHLVLPGVAESLDFTLSVIEPFMSVEPLVKAQRASLEHITLDESTMISDTQWTTLRVTPAYPHMPWAGSRPPLEAVEKQTKIACDTLPLVDFTLPQRKFIPVSFKGGRPSYVLDLKGRTCRKLYLLVVAFLDNHDMFTEVGRVTVRSSEDVVYSRTLRFPGDLDWWFPPAVVNEFATVREARHDRLETLGQLVAEQADWKEGTPPLMPAPRFWSRGRSVVTKSSVMSVIEVDLQRPLPIASLTLESLGVDPSFGLVAVTADTSAGQESLRDTPWMPSSRFREPRVVFDFQRDATLQGWRVEGKAFSVASHEALFTTRTLNSLTAAGETATGKVISPDFVIQPGDAAVLINYHGGGSKPEGAAGQLAIDLVDSNSGKRLERLQMSSGHTLRWGRIPVSDYVGKTVRLELLDENSEAAYAWVGVACVKMSSE